MKFKKPAICALLVTLFVTTTGTFAASGEIYPNTFGLTPSSSDESFQYGMTVTGPVEFSSQYFASLLNEGGSISFYDPSFIGGPGQLSLINHFRQTADGSLTLRLGDESTGGYEQILVGASPPFSGFGDPSLGANVYLDGKLIFTKVDGYIPKEGDSFAIFGTQFTSIEVSLTADDITFFDIPDDLYWDLSSFYTQGIIKISAIPEISTTAIALGLCAIALMLWRKRT